jgi:hypothetical protein
MKPGDLVRWKATGKLSIYLGIKDDLHQFYSPEFGIIERWVKAASIFTLCEVVNEGR